MQACSGAAVFYDLLLDPGASGQSFFLVEIDPVAVVILAVKPA
jgi:hypothetical protein